MCDYNTITYVYGYNLPNNTQNATKSTTEK